MIFYGIETLEDNGTLYGYREEFERVFLEYYLFDSIVEMAGNGYILVDESVVIEEN